MQQKHVFWGNFFPLFVFGHFFCPFSTFPKYFQSKKLDILYNKSLGVLKENMPDYIELNIWNDNYDNQGAPV
jgi:hypothetical protein